MSQYLLSMHTIEGEVGPSMTDEEMQESWKKVVALNEELRASGAWIFGGALQGPDAATVVRDSDGEVVTTDGPFAESKEQIGGFYIIEASTSEDAVTWASKTSAAIGKPIEVRPFRESES